MRKFIAFMAIFSIVLMFGYLEPIFFPMEEPQKSANNGRQEVFHTALPYEKITTSGYASYIGKPLNEFIADFGEPKETSETTMGYQRMLFEDDYSYTEVNVKNNIISAIKALNGSDQTLPFKINMELSAVSSLTTIYSTFAFTYETTNYNIELTEADMNYRPLIAFDNDTFAILFFDAQQQKLLGIYYLDKETLLTVMPYRLIEGAALPILQITDLKQNNLFDSRLLVKEVNTIRKNRNLSAYTLVENTENVQQLLTTFTEKPEKILTSDRISAWEISSEEASATTPFYLKKEEFQKLVKLAKLDRTKMDGIYLEPVYDPTFSLLFCFSTNKLSSALVQKEKKDISVALSGTNMLILVKEFERDILKTEDSD